MHQGLPVQGVELRGPRHTPLAGTFKAAVHERVLNEMLGSVNQGGWKVLILDDLTTRCGGRGSPRPFSFQGKNVARKIHVTQCYKYPNAYNEYIQAHVHTHAPMHT